MQRFDFIIFDLDGVLVNTSPCHSRAYGDLWREIGIDGPQYEVIAGRRTRDVISEFTAQLTPSQAQFREWILFKQLQARKYLDTETIAYSDSVSCLETLARHGIRLALGTAASRETTYLVLSRLGIADFFSIVVTAEEVGSGKPSPEIYSKIMIQARVIPGKTLIIEDSLSGLEAAVRAEAYAASVRTGIRVDAPRFVGSFSNLHDLLLGMEFTSPRSFTLGQ